MSKKIKLSTLLSKGAKKLKKRITGTPFQVDRNGDLCGCAIGAIAVGCDYNPLTPTGKLKRTANQKAYDIIRKLLYENYQYGISDYTIYDKNDAGMSFSEMRKYLADLERIKGIKEIKTEGTECSVS